MDTTSYFHSAVSFLTPETMRLGVRVGPEENSRAWACPVARTLTCVPPMSTTSTFKWEASDILRLLRDFTAVILGTINPGLQLATACLSVALLDVITAIRSFQDLTNDFAPSS